LSTVTRLWPHADREAHDEKEGKRRGRQGRHLSSEHRETA